VKGEENRGRDRDRDRDGDRGGQASCGVRAPPPLCFFLKNGHN